MATMNVSLPGPMKAWVEAQAQTGRYSDASDDMRDLIRRDQEQADRLAALRRYLDESEASGTSSRSAKEIIAEARATARARGLLVRPFVKLRTSSSTRALRARLRTRTGEYLLPLV